MDMFLFLIVLPGLGVLWFLNFSTFLEKLHRQEDTMDQKIIGAILTFILFVTLIFSYILLNNY